MKKIFFLLPIGAVLVISLSLGVSAWTTARPASAQTTTRTELEEQLKAIEEQIKELESELRTTTSEKQKLAAKIKQLQTEQSVLRLKIRSTSLEIKKLDSQIDTTEAAIEKNLTRTARVKTQLALAVKLLNQRNPNLILTLFADEGLGGVFTDLENQIRMSSALNGLIDELKTLKKELNERQEELNDKQDDTKNLLALQTIQQYTLGERIKEEDTLYQETKGKESNYQILLKAQRERAAQIRNRIYELFEATRTITFGEAVAIANWVASVTKVRAAYLLAVLTQESNLGKNVGTCNRAGDPPEKSWREVMKPERDQEPFLKITAELGLDPDTTPVSCPMRDKNGKRIGWGGAMGPAQFIPSTWLGYKERVAALTGKTVANPWDIRDAFVAAGIKLAAGGATTPAGEWRAAMLYFSGSTSPRFRFYADNVAALATRYQNDINALQ